MKTRKVLKLGRGEEKTEIFEEYGKFPKEPSQRRLMYALSLASELGFAISLPIVGGAFVGKLLDEKFLTAPRMTLSFIFIGIGIACANMYRVVKETEKK